MFKNKKLPTNYWLCLGGGAARGLAHIWVYKYLYEKNKLPSEISGNSMWAVVASAIAVSMSYEEIYDIVKKINYLKLIDFDFKSGLLWWDKILKFFDSIFADKTFENTKIPLKIVATDIQTGQTHLFDKWKISSAVRASISIPGIFRPQYIDWKYLVDWLVTCNLPVQYLSAKNVLSVSVTKEIDGHIDFAAANNILDFSKNFFTINAQILQKTYDIMLLANEKASLKTRWKKVRQICLDLDDIDYFDFDKFEEIVNGGYEYMVSKFW